MPVVAGWQATGRAGRGDERRSGVQYYKTDHEAVHAPDAKRREADSWLNHSRRLIYSDASSAYVIDTASRHTHELFSVVPYQDSDLTVTRDNRHLYVSVRAYEADVWVANPR